MNPTTIYITLDTQTYRPLVGDRDGAPVKVIVVETAMGDSGPVSRVMFDHPDGYRDARAYYEGEMASWSEDGEDDEWNVRANDCLQWCGRE